MSLAEHRFADRFRVGGAGALGGRERDARCGRRCGYRVTDDQQIACARRGRDRVGQREPPRVGDHQQIQILVRHQLRVGEIGRGAADHAAVDRVVQETPIPAGVDHGPFGRRDRDILLGHQLRQHADFDDRVQQVLHDRRSRRHHTDPPTMPGDHPLDHSRRGDRLPGAGRALHRQIGIVE